MALPPFLRVDSKATCLYSRRTQAPRILLGCGRRDPPHTAPHACTGEGRGSTAAKEGARGASRRCTGHPSPPDPPGLRWDTEAPAPRPPADAQERPQLRAQAHPRAGAQSLCSRSSCPAPPILAQPPGPPVAAGLPVNTRADA